MPTKILVFRIGVRLDHFLVMNFFTLIGQCTSYEREREKWCRRAGSHDDRCLLFIIGKMIVAVDRFAAHVANEEATRRTRHLIASFDLVESLDDREREKIVKDYASKSMERTWVHRGHLRIIASVTCSSMNLRISSSTPFSTSSHRSGIWLGSWHNLKSRVVSATSERERRSFTGMFPSYIRDSDIEILYHRDCRQ